MKMQVHPYFPSRALWIWAISLMTIVVYSIAWFTLAWPYYMVVEAVENSYTFESPADLTIDLMNTVVEWHPIIMILGLLLWAFVASQRREDITYPRRR